MGIFTLLKCQQEKQLFSRKNQNWLFYYFSFKMDQTKQNCTVCIAQRQTLIFFP